MQHNKYVEHQDVNIYCATNQFPELKFLGPQKKPHGVSGLGKNYNIRFDTKLGHMEHVQYAASLVLVLSEPLCSTKTGVQVFQHRHNISTNM